MRVTRIALCIAALGMLTLTSCASSMSGSAYRRDQARQAQTVHEGTVVYVRPVQIEGTKSGLGTIAGGIMGAALGSTIGGGSGRVVATAAEGVTRQNGLEITVELDNGEVIAVAQAADEIFEVGDRVRVLRRPGGEARVIQ